MSTTSGLSSTTRILAAGVVKLIANGPHGPKGLYFRAGINDFALAITEQRHHRGRTDSGRLRKACQPTITRPLSGFVDVFARITCRNRPCSDTLVRRCARVAAEP